MKALMSDTQYRALTEVLDREGEQLVRFVDASVSTLIAMARPGRRWVDIVWATVDGKRQIVSATVRHGGRTAYAAETERRRLVAAEEALQARIAAIPAPARAPKVSITAQVDPFALFTPEPALPF